MAEQQETVMRAGRATKKSPARKKQAKQEADVIDQIVRATEAGERGIMEVEVGPDLATRLLAYNLENRNESTETIRAYARDMQAGNWIFTGDPIRCAQPSSYLNIPIQMIDGQHRLHAIMEANITLPLYIVYGLDERARFALDMGRRRNLADVLKLSGYQRTTRLASAARFLIALKTNNPHARATHAENMDMVHRHKGLQDAVTHFDRVPVISPSLLSALYYVLKDIMEDVQAAAALEYTFAQGGSNYAGDPLHMLRERVIREATNQQRPSRTKIFYALIRAVNGYRKRETLQRFVYPEEPIGLNDLNKERL